MRQRIFLFITADDGAVTVDWVVLTAAVVGIAAGIYAGLEQSVFDLGNAAAGAVVTENDF